MPIAVSSPWGGRDVTAYVTVIEATSYIRASKIFYDEWTEASESQLEAASVSASRNIDSRIWHGGKFFYLQSLEFPRVSPGMSTPYGTGSRSVPDATFASYFESDEHIRLQKQRVQQATAEQMLYLLQHMGRSPHRESQFRGIRSQSRGLKFSESYGYGDPDQVLCPEAMDLLRYYRGTTRLRRG